MFLFQLEQVVGLSLKAMVSEKKIKYIYIYTYIHGFVYTFICTYILIFKYLDRSIIFQINCLLFQDSPICSMDLFVYSCAITILFSLADFVICSSTYNASPSSLLFFILSCLLLALNLPCNLKIILSNSKKKKKSPLKM